MKRCELQEYWQKQLENDLSFLAVYDKPLQEPDFTIGGEDMSFVKNTFGFFKRKILRIHTPHNQVVKNLPKKRHAMSTFRTYELGGDPFNDRIEFYLTDGSTAGGFGDPVPDGEVRKPIRELTEDEIRAAFGSTEK